MKRMRKLVLAATTLATVGVFAGCDGGGAVGTFTLKTVNGVALPAVIIQIGTTFKLEITAGSATLNEDKTYSSSITFKETDGTTITTTTETDSGTYTVSGSTVTFASPGTGSSFTGTISGNVLTVTDQEQDVVIVLVFEK